MHLRSWLWLFVAVALVACGGGGGDDDGGGGQEPTPTPTPTPTPDDPAPSAPTFFSTGFMRGGTMSFAQYMLDKGFVYREDGVATDPYASMKRHGANVVRLQLNRVAFATYNGQWINWPEWNRVVADAKKAAAEGTNHNLLPAVWKGLDEVALGNKLYEWVYETLENLAKENIYPRAVAVGNEVNIGFLKPSASAASDGARTGRLLKRGFEAVRAYAAKYNPNVQTILHIADPAKVISYTNAITGAGCTTFDLLGVSWYPGYDHSMAAFGDSPKKMAERVKELYGADLLIFETAASFTTGMVGGVWKGDNCNNAYNWPKWGSDAENAANYTPAKQREWLATLAAEVKAGAGAGLITWGTESLPDNQNKGLYTYPAAWAAGSTWENNSYWDFTRENNLHEGIDWMRDVQ